MSIKSALNITENCLSQFLKNHHPINNNSTHVSIYPKKSYTFSRNDFDKFWKIYKPTMVNCLAEIPGLFGIPLYIDIDIKKTEQEYKNGMFLNGHFYNKYEIYAVIKIVNKHLKYLTNCDDSNLVCCLLEKDIYQREDGKYSNGYHLHYPFITLNKFQIVSHLLPLIEPEILEACERKIDHVYNNAWLVYGASKKPNLKPYVLTKIYNSKLNEMTTFETFRNYELFDIEEEPIKITQENVDNLLHRIFSIHSIGKGNYYKEIVNELPLDIAKKQKQKIEYKSKKREDLTEEQVKKNIEKIKLLLPLINHDSDNNHSLWFSVLCAISFETNQNPDMFEIFDEWCYDGFDTSGTYNRNENEKAYYNTFGGSIGTLINLAKKDNPIEFAKISHLISDKKKVSFENGLPELILNECTHNNLAKLYSEYCEGEIFYTTGYGWIIFNQKTKIWTYNNDRTSLVYPISTFFSKTMKEYRTQISKIETTDKESEKELQKKIKQIGKCIIQVGNSGFIEGIIKQLQSLLTKDNDFINEFDNKPNLFAFSDAKLIDLNNNGNVREIVKEDYIMTTTGYPYPKRNIEYIAKMRCIINSLSDDTNQIKSILSLLSLPLWGDNKNEIFAQLTGTGGNGKGLVDTGCQKVYGNYYCAIDSSQLTEYQKDKSTANSSLASCRFARMVMAVEPEDNNNDKKTTLKTPTIKKWTGRDIIQARFLYKDVIKFYAKFVLMMQLNELVDLSTNDEAIKRRMKVVELPFKFVKNEGQVLGENEKYRDESLKTLISTPEYRDAFFYILLDNWLETKGIFFESQKVKEYTNEFFDSQNPLKEWFEGNFEVHPDGKMNSDDLLKSYKENGGDSFMTATKFGKFLKQICRWKKSNKIVYQCKKKSIRLLLEDDSDVEN